MFQYHEIIQNESCVLIAEFESGNYRMAFQFMYQDNHHILSFAQNQVPNNDTIDEMRLWVEPLFEWHRVMNIARNSILNCMNLDQLHHMETH
jgi:hypothetical protein